MRVTKADVWFLAFEIAFACGIYFVSAAGLAGWGGYGPAVPVFLLPLYWLAPYTFMPIGASRPLAMTLLVLIPMLLFHAWHLREPKITGFGNVGRLTSGWNCLRAGRSDAENAPLGAPAVFGQAGGAQTCVFAPLTGARSISA